MRKQTIQLTTGALMVAIFGMILLLDRQTGRMFESAFLIIFPVPMVIYTAKYGWKSGVPVLIAMSLISVIFASPMMIFYGVTQSLVGLIFGAQVQRRANMTQTLFVVILLTVIFTVLDFFVLSALMGNDVLTYIDESMPEMQETMRNMQERLSQTLPGYDSERTEQVIAYMTADVMKEVMVIVAVIEGAIQGFLEFEISLLLMNRLRMPVEKPKSLFLYFPPRWFGTLLTAVFCVYCLGYSHISNRRLQITVQGLGFASLYCLAFFGCLGIVLWIRTKRPRSRILGPLLALLLFFSLPYVLVVVGVIYLTTDWHERWVDELEGQREASDGRDRAAAGSIPGGGGRSGREGQSPDAGSGNTKCVPAGRRREYEKLERRDAAAEKKCRRSITDIANMLNREAMPQAAEEAPEIAEELSEAAEEASEIAEELSEAAEEEADAAAQENMAE